MYHNFTRTLYILILRHGPDLRPDLHVVAVHVIWLQLCYSSFNLDSEIISHDMGDKKVLSVIIKHLKLNNKNQYFSCLTTSPNTSYLKNSWNRTAKYSCRNHMCLIHTYCGNDHNEDNNNRTSSLLKWDMTCKGSVNMVLWWVTHNTTLAIVNVYVIQLMFTNSHYTDCKKVKSVIIKYNKLRYLQLKTAAGTMCVDHHAQSNMQILGHYTNKKDDQNMVSLR